MTDKQIIIDDQKKTIHRLQDECTEKTNAIIALGEQLKAKTQECEELKETIQIQNKMQMEVCEEKNTELDQLKVNKKQAEQKLEQIRELAIVLKNICPYITIEGNDSERAIDEILQIISEEYNSLAEDCTSELDTPSASQIIDEVE